MITQPEFLFFNEHGPWCSVLTVTWERDIKGWYAVDCEERTIEARWTRKVLWIGWNRSGKRD